MPFQVPLREWFKQDEFNDRLSALERRDFGLNSSVISDIVQANRSGQNDYGDFIWRLFVLKHWMDAPSRLPITPTTPELNPSDGWSRSVAACQ